MKMKKLFAGLTAVATLLGGMAFGAVAANADDENAGEAPAGIVYGHTITMHSDNYNQFKKSDGSLRDYAFVKIADYVDDGYTGVTLKTTEGTKDAVKAALKSLRYDPESGEDPLAWLSKQGDAAYRQFVDAIDPLVRPETSNLNQNGTNPPTVGWTKNPEPCDPKTDSTCDPEAQGKYNNTVTFDFGTDKGLYLIFDLSGDQEFTTTGSSTTTVHPSKTVMVGTSITGAVPQPDNADGQIEAKGDETPNSQFEFVKKNRDGDILPGAEFEVKYDSGELKGQLVYFKKVDSQYQALDYQKNNDGKYAKDDDGNFIPPTGTDITNHVVSGQDGKIHINGLQPGWYVVTETKAPEGYSDKYLPSFKIMVNNQGIVSSYIGKEDGDPYDLVVDQNGLTVINLRPTELPKTGAAGIAAFFAVAALLGGAGVTVFLKSRSTKRALRA